MWDEVVEKVNKDYECDKKEFWAFVKRNSKRSSKSIASLRGNGGSLVTSTQGKLNILKQHYEKVTGW